MASLEEYYKINFENAKSKQEAIFQGDKYRITVLTESLIRFEYDEKGEFENRPTEFALNRNFEVPKMSVNQDSKYLVITTKYFKLEYKKGNSYVGSFVFKEANLKVMLVGTEKKWYFNHPEARNFLGTNKKITDKIEKNNLTKGLYSTDGFASIDDTDSLVFDVNGFLRKRNLPKGSIDTYLFMYKRDFGECLRSYFALTGAPTLIRRSALGIWWNKEEDYNFEEVKELINDFNKHDIPISNLVLANSWSTKDKENPKNKRTGYTFNKELFPSPFELTNYLHERGVNLALNIDPSEGILPNEQGYEELALNYNLKTKKSIPFNAFSEDIIDLFLNKLLKPLNNVGVDFFFLDCLTKNLNNIRPLIHYIYTSYNQNDKKRGLILSYNGLKASHRYPVYYSGKTTVDWKTLKELPYYNSRSANIGVSWWSHTIGGYKDGIEDPELYMRYVQLGTFSPIFRFSSMAGHYYKREPWHWDVKIKGITEDYCQFRQRLIPYLYAEAYKYHKTGLPLIQPLYYKYPQLKDEPVYKNEYFFGTELFIAPITNQKDQIMNRAIHRIFMPNGMWYDFKTGKKFPGGKRYITFFQDENYPVFAKSGSIIPLAVLEKNKNVCTPPRSMEVHVFPGLSNTYKLYEDDGESNLYKDGYYIVTNIDYNYQENNYTLIIRPTEGKSGIIPPKRDYKIRFRNTKQADEVIIYVDENKIEFNAYEDEADFVIEVKDIPTTKQLTINCKGQDIEIDAVRIINEEIDSIISDLQIRTVLKEKIALVIYSDKSIQKKRIALRKLKKDGLDKIYIRMFLKLLEYIAEI